MKKVRVCLETVLFTSLFFYGCAATNTKTVSVANGALVDMRGAKSVQLLPFELADGVQADSANLEAAARSAQYLYQCLADNLEDSPYLKLRKAGADAVLSGFVSDFAEEVLAPDAGAGANAEGGSVYVRRVALEFSYDIVGGKTGEVYAQRMARVESRSKPAGSAADLPACGDLAALCMPRLANIVMRDLQPQSAENRVSLIKVNKKSMRAAYKLFLRGEYSNAKSRYLDVYKSERLFEAGYNAARIMQIRNETAEAKALFAELFAAHKDKRAADALHQIEEDYATALDR